MNWTRILLNTVLSSIGSGLATAGATGAPVTSRNVLVPVGLTVLANLAALFQPQPHKEDETKPTLGGK